MVSNRRLCSKWGDINKMEKLEQKFLIKNKKTEKLEEFEVAEVFPKGKSSSYGILLKNSNGFVLLPVTCYSNGGFSINNSLGKDYEVPEKTQEELKTVLN